MSSWEADPQQDRAHAPGEEARGRMATLFGIPAYVLTPDFGMQNFQQVGLKLGQLEQEQIRPSQGTVMTPPPSQPEGALDTRPSRGEIDRYAEELEAKRAGREVPVNEPPTHRIVQGMAGLERQPVLHNQREEVVIGSEARPQQIITTPTPAVATPSVAPPQEERPPAPVLPVPEGVTRIL